MEVAATLEREGFAVVPRVVDGEKLAAIDRALDALPLDGAGTRNLLLHAWCRELAAQLRNALPVPPVAIQCTLFDKTPTSNWLVALHQDLAVPVRERVDRAGLRGWSVKEGQYFVQPPEELLARLVAVRLHVDSCAAANGPLRVVPGSHRRGRIPEHERAAVRDACGEWSCLLDAGGALLLSPLLLHASSKATVPRRRRVLHFLFGPSEPGYGLDWPVA